MATSTGVTTRSRAKILTTTITPCLSDEEESKEATVKDSPNRKKVEEDNPANEKIVKDEPKKSVDVDGEKPQSDTNGGTDSLENLANDIDRCVDQKAEGELDESNQFCLSDNIDVESKERVTIEDKLKVEDKLLLENVDKISQHSFTESAVSVQEAISDVLKEIRASEQFDDGYEEDEFLLKAKKMSGGRPSNGHVPAVDPLSADDDQDMNRINHLFGTYEYEDHDGPKEESEEESILSDPSDLHEESGPEEDLVEDDIENYGKHEKAREINCFIDDEAVEDNTKNENAGEKLVVPCFSSDDESNLNSDEDRAIRSPLNKKNFLDEEAVEDNNLKALYGWSDCSDSQDEIQKEWKWNHEDSDRTSCEEDNVSEECSDDSFSDEVADGECESDFVTSDDEVDTIVPGSEVMSTKGTNICLDTSDEEEVHELRRQKRKSRPRIIDDDDEGSVVKEVIGNVEIDEVLCVFPVKPKHAPNSSEEILNHKKTVPLANEDCEIMSTSSVFTVTPLDHNYQPGRNNRQIFKISPLQDKSPKDVTPAKRKRSEDDFAETASKKAKSCNIPNDFILGQDLVFMIDAKKMKQDNTQNVVKKLSDLLQEALGERVTAISIKHYGEDNEERRIVIGLNLNVNHAYETVVKGPSADNDREVKKFEAFWGKRVEIRRYPDLTILASVHFPASTLAEKRNIVPEIVRYIISVHFKIPPHDIIVLDQEISKVLTSRRNRSRGTGEEELLAVSESFEGLRKKLRELGDLPLGISSIRGISPSFRGADVFPLKTGRLNNISCLGSKSDKQKGRFGCLLLTDDLKFIPRLVKPHEVIVELETSGKWPDDVDAIRQVKTQILYNFMAQIHLNYKLPVRLTANYLDVLNEFFVFRIYIAAKKEVIVLRQFKNDTGIMLAKRGRVPEADDLEMMIEYLPTLTSALNGISTQFITYNTAVRLAKRWLSSQYLYGLLPELTTELIVARVYLSPSDRGYTGFPNSPLNGFMRFLELVSKFKWGQEPLFVDMNKEFTESKISQIKKSYHQIKEKPPFMICTPYDLSPGYFTKVSGITNSAAIFDTFVRNAKSSFNCLMEMMREPERFNFLKLFHHPTEDYHVVIHLKHEFIATSFLSLQPDIVLPPSKSKKSVSNWMPVTDFDIVEKYLESLRKCYEKQAIFFYDHFGGTKVLVYFTPDTLKKFSKNNGLNDQTSDYEKMIEDIRSMGHGIIDHIHVNADKWT